MIDPKVFAQSTLHLLQQDPRRYVNFGVYWFFVKALMKRYYTRDNLYMLGDYEDPGVIARMPDHGRLQETLEAAVEEYRLNAMHNMGRKGVSDPSGGGSVTIHDEDAGF